MKKRIFVSGFAMLVLLAAVSACGPTKEQLATQTALMDTATATMWTLTPTVTPTFTPTITPTKTNTPTPDPYYHERRGAVPFSYLPPLGWKKDTSDGVAKWVAPDGQSTLNFAIDTGISSMTAKTAAQTVITVMRQQGLSVSILSQGVFQNDAGYEGYKIDATITMFGIGVHTVIYTLRTEDVLISSEFILKVGGSQSYEPKVDQCVASIRLD